MGQTVSSPMQPSGLVFLVFGSSGWIGGMICDCLEEQGYKFYRATSRLEDRASLKKEIAKVSPTNVINAAGIIGKPNVDWCESHKIEVIRANVIGCLNLADVCHEMGVHLVHFGSGCIYSDSKGCLEGKEQGFTEDDPPNFGGSYFSHTKLMSENMIKEFPNTLTLRLRAPIVADLTHSRNFIAKIMMYEKIINIPNSMTVLPELVPLAVELAVKRSTGVLNFTNPGVISHNEILLLYKEYIDPQFTWQNFTLEEQDKVLLVPRSNNKLDTSRLQLEFPIVLPIKDSLIKYVFEPNATKKDEVKKAVDEMRNKRY